MEFLARNLTKDSSLLFHAKSLRLAYFKENYTLVKNTHLRHFYLLKKFENISKLFAVQCKDQRIRVRTEQLCKRMIRCTAGYFKYFSSNQFCQIISLNSTKRICFSTDLAMTRRNPLDFIGKSPLLPTPRCCAFSFLVLDGFPICRADKGLGLSIAGGLGSTPYKECRHLRYEPPP